MFRRPARDRNYEFWGDQQFFGENPPLAAVISWFNKRQPGDVKLKITDAAGREVREISGDVLAKSKAVGIQSACWDLRVQPAPAPPPQAGRGQAAGATPPAAPAIEQTGFGAGCTAPATGGGGGFGGGGVATAGPYVIGGVYNVALIVDGKTVDTKPLRVNDDPEVILTSTERKKNFDLAMELHAMQPRITDAGVAVASLTRQMNELSTTIAGRTDIPADAKASFDAFNKELTALAPKLALPQGGRGGGGGGRGNNESMAAKLGQAKNGYMGGMTPGDQTVRAYTEVKSQTPKAIADLNALIAKGAALSNTLAKYNLTLTVPEPVKAPEIAPAKKASSVR
jgi:hypothetical protein